MINVVVDLCSKIDFTLAVLTNMSKNRKEKVSYVLY